MNCRVKMYREHCTYAILSFMRRFYAIVGLQMVNYKTLRLNVTKIGKIYCFVLIGTIFYGSARYIEDVVFTLESDRLTLYYAFLEALECSTGIVTLFTESIYRTEEKSKVYAKLRRIDKIMDVKPMVVISMIAMLHYISLIYEIIIYVHDFFAWEYNSKTVLALLKTLCIDLIVLQFVAEMHSNLARMKILNDYMKNSLCDSVSVNAERCEFLTSWKLMPDEEKNDKKKDLSVLELAKIYKDLTDNIMVIIKRFKIPVNIRDKLLHYFCAIKNIYVFIQFSLLTAGTICVVIIVIQIILLNGKSQDDVIQNMTYRI